MSRISETRLADFLDEISAAVRAETPLPEAMNRLQKTRVGWVARTAKSFAENLSAGRDPAASLSTLDRLLGEQAGAAMRLCQSTGDPTALQRLAQQLRRRSEWKRESWIAWIYPVLLVWVGYAVMVFPFFSGWSSNQFETLVEISTLPTAARPIAEFLNQHAAGIGIALLLGTAVILFGKITLRGRLPHHARRQLMCTTLADQVELGVADQTAVKTAALIAGESRLAAAAPETLEASPVAAWLSDFGVDSLRPEALPDRKFAFDDQHAMVAALRTMASRHEYLARRSGYFWTRMVPGIATVLIGGSMILGYLWFVIFPIYSAIGNQTLGGEGIIP